MTGKKLLVTRPEYDKVTNYLSSWSHEVILAASKKGFQVKDLGADNVNEKNFSRYVKKQKPSFIMINGHGSPDCIVGHGGKILLEKGRNEDLLKGSVAYALSCNSAAGLGPSAVENGAKAYIGYKLSFGFLTNKNKECTPEEDELANYFKEASNQVPLTLIKGKGAGLAYERSQHKFKELISGLSASDSVPEAKELRFWLFWDMNAQALIGDKKART